MAKTAERLQEFDPPKQVGDQLRELRRKHGLSRSDVARSAGLTRRELAAYERGRVEVPDNDLLCLAGSCGVDVAELLLTPGSNKVAPATPIETNSIETSEFFAPPRASDPFLPPPAAAEIDLHNSGSPDTDAPHAGAVDPFWILQAAPVAVPEWAEAATAVSPAAIPAAEDAPVSYHAAEASVLAQPVLAQPGVEAPAVQWTSTTVTQDWASPGEPGAVAGQWRMGNTSPATAMDDGGLALRRADARWAFAGAAAPHDFTVETAFDFRSGAGFGVLFRATVDQAEQLTAYSFDIDAIAGDSAFVLRQWEHGQPHWRPLAQMPADAARIYGRHTIAMTLHADRLVVTIDNEPVLQHTGVSQSSIELGHAPCQGAGIGIQAWATTEVAFQSFHVVPQ